jgi:hypothetical protein
MQGVWECSLWEKERENVWNRIELNWIESNQTIEESEEGEEDEEDEEEEDKESIY